ncbi:MAG: nucleotidyl transferase AbiEii/AbiGii toxin family protein [Polyangiales bacterium]
MTNEPTPLGALAEVAEYLRKRRTPFALVGGLAVSARGEVRFTRDVDLAVALDDRAVETLVRDLRAAGYRIDTLLEHETAGRIATVRLRTRTGILVDILCGSSGIEPEIVAGATVMHLPEAGDVAVAQAEELIAMKVLSMTDRRLQDRIDARALLENNPDVDLERVRLRLRQIEERGFDRGEDLSAKLAQVLVDAGR